MRCAQGWPWSDQRITSGLEWVAARMGLATTKIILDFTICELKRCSMCDDRWVNHLIAATSNLKKKPLTSLRCLILRLLHSPDGCFWPRAHYEEDVLEDYLWWLLANMPCLEALCLRLDTSLYYSLANVGLDRLKHLELQTIRHLDVVCLEKTRLPVLETLCINGQNPFYRPKESIDMRGVDVLDN